MDLGKFEWPSWSSIKDGIRFVMREVVPVAVALAPVVKKLANALPPQAKGPVIAICTILEQVGRVMALIPQEMPMTEFGERVLQAEEQGITLESYGKNYADYLQKLESMELDMAKLHTEFEQYLSGALTIEKVLLEKRSPLSTANSWEYFFSNPEFFEKRMTIYRDLALEQGVDVSTMINAYFGEEGSLKDARTSASFMEEAERRLNPSASRMEILELLSRVDAEMKK